MLCEQCGKNKATVHWVMDINGKKMEKSLCQWCASKQDMSFLPFSIDEMMSEILSMGAMDATSHQERSLTCSRCGMTYARFKQIGKLGCSQCYQVFQDALTPIIRRIHGRQQHVGKMPKKPLGRLDLAEKLRKLRDELAAVVSREDFERAVVLRDKIRELEKEKGG